MLSHIRFSVVFATVGRGDFNMGFRNAKHSRLQIADLQKDTINLTFMGLCIANIFQYISNKTQLYTVYLYLETALHVSGGNSTHHQERIQLYLQHLVCHTVIATCRYRGRAGTGLSVLWVAYATHSTHIFNNNPQENRLRGRPTTSRWNCVQTD